MDLKLSRPSPKRYFATLLPLALLIEGVFTATLDWSAYPRSEWVPLLNLCVFLPLVYLAFFSSGAPLKTRIVHAMAIAGLGLLAAKMMVPEANQFVIGYLSEVRGALLVVILAVEGFVFWKVLQALYKTGADAKASERDFAMPPFVAKLLVMEAKFWKAVWGFFRRK